MNITWVTSFNEKLWLASGKQLVSSFIKYTPDGKLLCTTENCSSILLPMKDCLWYANITNHSWLEMFKLMNKEIIPKEFGGVAQACRCKNDKRHKTGCHWTWWNRNAFRWYRKSVSLHYALKTWPKTDYLIWIDCDCYFKSKGLSEDYICDILFGEDEYDCFYLKGPDRSVIETGLIGYNLRKNGRKLLEQISDCYQTKKFRTFQRWDDCYITQKYLKKYKCNDIAGKKGKHSEVFSSSLVSQFIYHNKGLHGRVQGIYK